MRFSDWKFLFSKIKWSQKQLVNGMLIEYDGDTIDKSSIVYLVSPDGAKSPLPDGQYKTKEGVLFELTDGKVSSVEDNNFSQPAPIKQAQSGVEEENTNTNPMSTNQEIPLTEVKATEETVSEIPVKEDSTLFIEAFSKALAPINEALQKILSTIGTTTAMAEETKTELSKVKETVTKLAEDPAPEKKEVKIVSNPFASETPSDISETATYKIMKAASVKK